MDISFDDSELAVAKDGCNNAYRFFLHLVAVAVASLRSKSRRQTVSYENERSTNAADIFFLSADIFSMRDKCQNLVGTASI